MNRMHRRLTATAAAVTLMVVLAACSGGNDVADGPSAEPSETTSQVTHNDADVQFAQLMIAHHEGALEMAEVAVERASTPEVTALAERIATAQGPEIKLMTTWLEGWGEEATHGSAMGDMDMGGMEMDGMSQAEVMDELGSLQGSEFDAAFLTRMTAHHLGAITMAEQEKAEGSDPEALALAGKIIDAQTTEITEMENLLAGR